MTIKLINTAAFGSTAKYIGNVYARGVRDGISKITCPVTGPWVRSMHNISYFPQVDGEYSVDLTAFTSAESTLFHTVTGTPSGNRVRFLRSPDYIYFQNQNETYLSISEYCIADGTTTTVLATTNYAYTAYVKFTVLDDRKVVVLVGKEDGDYMALNLVDFEAGTSTELTSFLINITSGDNVINLQPYRGNMVTTVHEGKTFTIISGWYFWEDTENDNAGSCFIIYDHTDDITTTTYEFHTSDNNKKQASANYYTRDVVVNGKVITFPSTQSDTDSGLDDFALAAFHVLDLDTLTHTVIEYDLPAEHDVVYAYGLIGDIAENSVLAYYSDVWYPDPNKLIKIDLGTSAVTEVTTSAGGWSFAYGNDNIYIYSGTDDKWYDRDMTEMLAFAGPANGYNEADNMCIVLDESDDRIWYYDSTGPALVGLRLSDGDEKTIAVTPTYPTVSPTRMTVLLLGDVFVLGKFKAATDVTEYYIVRNNA